MTGVILLAVTSRNLGTRVGIGSTWTSCLDPALRCVQHRSSLSDSYFNDFVLTNDSCTHHVILEHFAEENRSSSRGRKGIIGTNKGPKRSTKA